MKFNFAQPSEGPNFDGTVFKVKGNHSMAKLQAKMTKERINLIGVIDHHANEKDRQRFEEMRLTANETREHSCFITPQFNFQSDGLQDPLPLRPSLPFPNSLCDLSRD